MGRLAGISACPFAVGGTWAADVPACSLYPAPQSFAEQWVLAGTDIAGATSPHYTPTGPGSYSCRVTAANRGGSTSQTSAGFSVFGPS